MKEVFISSIYFLAVFVHDTVPSLFWRLLHSFTLLMDDQTSVLVSKFYKLGFLRTFDHPAGHISKFIYSFIFEFFWSKS